MGSLIFKCINGGTARLAYGTYLRLDREEIFEEGLAVCWMRFVRPSPFALRAAENLSSHPEVYEVSHLDLNTLEVGIKCDVGAGPKEAFRKCIDVIAGALCISEIDSPTMSKSCEQTN